MSRFACTAIAALVLAASSRASAQPEVRAYVDEIAVFGDIEEAQARDHIERAVAAAGYRAVLAAPGARGCGNQSVCLAERTRRAHARIAIRATVLGLAGETSIALLIADVTSRTLWKHEARGSTLGELVPGLTAALGSARDDAPARSARSSRRRIAAYTLVAAGLGLAAGGALAYRRGYALRDAFFSDHIDADGNVVGIAPADAEREQARARRWILAGHALLVGAVAAELTGVVFFFGNGERAGTAGLSVVGTF